MMDLRQFRVAATGFYGMTESTDRSCCAMTRMQRAASCGVVPANRDERLLTDSTKVLVGEGEVLVPVVVGDVVFAGADVVADLAQGRMVDFGPFLCR